VLIGPVVWNSDSERFHLLVVCRGEGLLTFAGDVWKLAPGQAWLIPAALGSYFIDSNASLELLRVYVPSR